MRRRRALAALLAGAAGSVAAADAPPGGFAMASTARAGLLADAEAALARGDVSGALERLERAALLAHAADTEMALVRARLQRGEHAQALAFAAHVAGAHVDTPAATALYAWLLGTSGQGEFGLRLLDAALQRFSENTVLADTRRCLEQRGAVPTPLMCRAPWRMAPLPTPQASQPPASARTVATAALLPDGRGVVLPVPPAAHPCWVRDGLGRTARITIERVDAALGLALARTETPFDAGFTLPSPRTPFAGSAAHVVAFGPTDADTPCWPWLYSGFLGSGTASDVRRRLGVDVPPQTHGAPVFDAAGRMSGVSMRNEGQAPWLQPIESLRAAFGAQTIDARAEPAPAATVYERGLRVALQVIVATA